MVTEGTLVSCVDLDGYCALGCHVVILRDVQHVSQFKCCWEFMSTGWGKWVEGDVKAGLAVLALKFSCVQVGRFGS